MNIEKVKEALDTGFMGIKKLSIYDKADMITREIESWHGSHPSYYGEVLAVLKKIEKDETFFAESYHAKKCAECKKVRPTCALCGDPINVGVCENCVPHLFEEEK